MKAKPFYWALPYHIKTTIWKPFRTSISRANKVYLAVLPMQRSQHSTRTFSSKRYPSFFIEQWLTILHACSSDNSRTSSLLMPPPDNLATRYGLFIHVNGFCFFLWRKRRTTSQNFFMSCRSISCFLHQCFRRRNCFKKRQKIG